MITARPFDLNVESDPDPDLSSPTPTEPTGIFMVSVWDRGSIEQITPQDDDEIDFQTPTEQHACSSSEVQNIYAGEPTAVDLGESLRIFDLSDDTLVNVVND